MLIEEMRRERKVQELGTFSEINHFVVLCTYNSDRFRSKIESWLPKMDLTGTGLVIIDNQSTDETRKWILDLAASVHDKTMTIVNPVNVGGHGTIALNLDLLSKAKWVTTLHQDDSYSSNHVQGHRAFLDKSSTERLGMLCSEARSISPSGKLLPYPRAHWLLDGKHDPISVFLAHLKQHAYPESGATFNTEVLLNYPVPWHCNAFPDTEFVMKIVADYEVKFAKGITVEYLENPDSDSHAMAQYQRDFGVFFALTRVFGHPSFKKICLLVSQEDVGSFLKGLKSGIEARLEDPILQEVLIQIAMEMAAEHFGMQSIVAEYLLPGYRRVEDSRAVSVLGGMRGEIDTEFSTSPHLKTNSLPDVGLSPALKNISLTAGRLLPNWLLKRAFKALIATKLGSSIMRAWDFDWNRK